VPTRRLTALTLAAAALVLSLAPSARAQCVPDGFDSLPCCTPMSPTLPTFPGIASATSKFICFRDCAIQVNQNLCVTIDPPLATPICGVYTIRFKVRQCGGTMPILWQGNLRAHYSRNWQEANTAMNFGVWRLLVNGDMKATSTLTSNILWASPNIQPACYSTYGGIYVSGYIDYAFDCTASTWTAAWALNHECDRYAHIPGQPRGGAYHPTRSWTFLGPGAGFVVNTTTTLTGAGPVGHEAVRWNDWSTLPNICRAEEHSGGQIGSLGSLCPCSSSPGAPGQYENTSLNVVGTCGSFSRTSPAPNLALLQKRIGQWTNGAAFPGVEYLNIVQGDLDYMNSCTAGFSVEYFEGVTTLGGFPASDYSSAPLGRQQMDLGSSNRSPSSMVRRVGVPHVTQYLINVDMP